MITSASPSQEILEVVLDETKKATFWYTKKVNERNRDKLHDKLIADHRRTGKPQCSEMIDYTAKSGNKWCAFLRSYKFGDKFFTMIQSFMYRETTGSIEAFIAADRGGMEGSYKGVLIFTSHFFLRMSQRIGVKADSKELVQRFLMLSDSMIFNEKGDSKKRKAELEITICGTVWRGVYKDGDKRIVELKTLLRITELTKKERKSLRVVENAQKNVIVHNREADLKRIEGKDVALLREMYLNSFVLHASDKLSSAFEDLMVITRMTAEKLCLEYTMDEYINFILADFRSEAFITKMLVSFAYDKIKDKDLVLKTYGLVASTLIGLGHNIPLDVAPDFFGAAFKEYWSEPNEAIAKRRSFFKITDMSIFDSNQSLKISTSPQWARGVVGKMMKI